MLALIVGFVSGIICFIIGRVVTLYLIKDKFVIAGTLKISHQDDEDGPYMFADLDMTVSDIAKCKFVTYKIDVESLNPQK